jgi:hypothetical protein
MVLCQKILQQKISQLHFKSPNSVNIDSLNTLYAVLNFTCCFFINNKCDGKPSIDNTDSSTQFPCSAFYADTLFHLFPGNNEMNNYYVYFFNSSFADNIGGAISGNHSFILINSSIFSNNRLLFKNISNNINFGCSNSNFKIENNCTFSNEHISYFLCDEFCNDMILNENSNILQCCIDIPDNISIFPSSLSFDLSKQKKLPNSLLLPELTFTGNKISPYTPIMLISRSYNISERRMQIANKTLVVDVDKNYPLKYFIKTNVNDPIDLIYFFGINNIPSQIYCFISADGGFFFFCLYL